MTDNGAEYRSDHFGQVVTRLGIAVTLCPPYTPQFKGKVERVLRTLDQLGLSGLPGDLKGATNPDGSSRGDGRDLLTFEGLGATLEDILRSYHNRKHSTLGMTPTERWESDTGMITEMSEDELAPALLREDERRVGRYGVKAAVDGRSRFYNAHELANIRGRWVRIGYLPHDDTRLWVYAKDGTLLCVATPPDEWDDEGRRRFLAKRTAQARSSEAEALRAREARRAGFPTYSSSAAELPDGDHGTPEREVSVEPRRLGRRGERERRGPTASGSSREDEEIERLAFGSHEAQPR